MSLIFSQAEAQDVDQLVGLVNAAYRGETSKLGWTSEADLLDGRRTDKAEILQLLRCEDSTILTGKDGNDLVGCVYLQHNGQEVLIGMLAVDPLRQGCGVGKQLLQYAEQIAIQRWAVSKCLMTVISCRQQLIAFYQRRGYRRTGVVKEFPVNPRLWIPKVSGLQLEFLEKTLVF